MRNNNKSIEIIFLVLTDFIISYFYLLKLK